jgi:hypothetical protein
MTQVTTVSSPPITTGRFYFLKGRFKASNTNLYGLFLVIFNPQKGIEAYHAVVSTFSSIYDLEPHIEWHVFEEKITEIRWKGNCNASITTAIINIFDTINKDPRSRDEMYAMVSSYNYTQLEIVILDLINRIIRDKSTLLETGIQEGTPEEVLAIREDHRKKQEQKSAASAPAPASHTFKVEEGSTVIPVSMVLSPVRGKLLYELKIGDMIMLRFNTKTETGNYYTELYKLRTPEDKIKPIPGEVIDIKSDSKSLPVNILARIDNHFYGVATEEERHVRVHIYDPKLDGTYKSPIKASQPAASANTANRQSGAAHKHSSMTYLMMGVIAFLLMILLLILYIVM